MGHRPVHVRPSLSIFIVTLSGFSGNAIEIVVAIIGLLFLVPALLILTDLTAIDRPCQGADSVQRITDDVLEDGALLLG